MTKKRFLSLVLALAAILSIYALALPAQAEDQLATPKITSVQYTASGVTVSWDAVSGAAKYRVFYKEGSGWKKIADTAATSYTWTGAKSGNSYTLTVRCVSADGKTFTSGFDTAGKTISYFATPKLSSVSNAKGGVTVSWGAVPGAAKYRVYYKTGSGSWTKAGDTASTSYTWAGAKSGTTYAFTVRCLGADGTTVASAFETPGKSIAYVAAPKLSSMNYGSGGVSLSWDAVPGAAKYRVFYKDGSGWKKITDTAATSYTWSGAKSGSSYTFTVRCVSADGSTFTSAYDTAGRSITCLPTPKLSSVTNAAGGVTVSWGAVPGAAKYRVYYKTGSGSWTKAGDTAATSYTWAGAKSGTAYTFTVRCLSADGATLTSAFETPGKSITYVAAPKLSSVKSTASGVTVSWSAVSGAAKYRVFYKIGSGSWKKIADTTATSYAWTGAKSGTTYTFTVRCLSDDGKTYISGYNAAGKTLAYIAAPKLTAVSNTAKGVSLSWDAVPGAEKYRVFYKTGSGSWKKATDTADTGFIWTGAKSGTAYTFTVRCLSADGTAYTSAYDTVGKSITFMAAPKMSAVNNTPEGVDLAWEAVTGAEKYRVFYKTGSGDWTKLADTTATSYYWTNAVSGTAYSFTVCCLSADGKTCTSAYDPDGLSITYVPVVLDAPKLVSATNELGGAKIVWEGVSGASKYRVFYKTAETGSWKKLADTTATSYLWAGAESGTAYTFTVRCLSSNGKTFTSQFDTAGLPLTYIAAPEIYDLYSNTSAVVILWNSVPGASRYRVLRQDESGDWQTLVETAYSSYWFYDAEWDETYAFTVCCLDDEGNVVSAFDPVGRTHTHRLAPPEITSVTRSTYGSYVTIQWEHVHYGSSYSLFYKVGKGDWQLLADNLYYNTYYWYDAQLGKEYTFTLRCVDSEGEYIGEYDETGYTFRNMLDTPKLTEVSLTVDGISLKWDPIYGAAQYRVFYKTGSGSWKTIGDTAAPSYIWPDAKNDTAYTFTVRCLNEDGAFISDYDTVGKKITTPKLSIPRLTFVSNEANGVKISWKAVPGVTKYRVFYKNGTSWKKIADTTATSYTWTKAEPDTKYVFTVRCVAADGATFESYFDTNGISITTLTKELQQIYATGAFQFSYARPMLTMVNDLRTGPDAWYWDETDTEKVYLPGLGKLTYDYGLEQIAMQRAAELVQYFSHTRPDGTICFSLEWNGVKSWGENIAYGFSSTQSMFDGWAEAEDPYVGQGHRRNMLSSGFTAIGIACFQYNGRLYWVQEFGYSNSGMSN